MHLICRAILALPISWWAAGHITSATSHRPICIDARDGQDCVVVGSSTLNVHLSAQVMPCSDKKALLEQQTGLGADDEPAMPAAPLHGIADLIAVRSLAAVSRERVALRMMVDADGGVAAVAVHEATSPELAQDLGRVLMQARFVAARRGGTRVAVEMPVEFEVVPRSKIAQQRRRHS